MGSNTTNRNNTEQDTKEYINGEVINTRENTTNDKYKLPNISMMTQQKLCKI